MPDEEEWELTPHHQIEELKKEVEKLRKNPFAGTGSSENLLESMEKLNHSINELIEIFKMAHEDISAKELHTEEEKTEKLSEKMDKMADENRKIAEGIVSLAELLKKNVQQRPEAPMPRPLRKPPEISAPPFIPPKSPMPPPVPSQAPEEKKSLFDKFKK